VLPTMEEDEINKKEKGGDKESLMPRKGEEEEGQEGEAWRRHNTKTGDNHVWNECFHGEH